MRTTGFKAIVKAAIPSRVAVFSGGRKRASVALTFDDGPAPGITEEVVRILAGRGHRATFFIIGQRAEANPGIVDRIVRSGCEIGNHTYSHAAVTSLSYRKIQEEIERTERAVSAVIRHPLPFRPPKGLVSLPLLAYLWRQKPRGAPILWSVCVPRGHRKSVDEIVQTWRRPTSLRETSSCCTTTTPRSSMLCRAFSTASNAGDCGPCRWASCARNQRPLGLRRASRTA